METMVPKLVAEDIPLLHSLLSDVFPGVKYSPAEMKALRQEVGKVCKEMYLMYGEGDELGSMWVEKVRVTQRHSEKWLIMSKHFYAPSLKDWGT